VESRTDTLNQDTYGLDNR